MKAFNDDGRRLVLEALKEHKDVDELLTQISRLKTTDKNFDETMEMLIENVDYHVAEEEGEIFRFAKENCSQISLKSWGGRLQTAKKFSISKWRREYARSGVGRQKQSTSQRCSRSGNSQSA